jgi:hypothetical protein
MASPDLSFGERKFRHTYTGPLALAVLTSASLYAFWVFLREPAFAIDSPFVWTCVAAALINVAVLFAVEQTVLTISDQGIRRESIFGVKQMRWDEIRSTRYGVKLLRPRIPMGLIGAMVAAARRPKPIKLRLTILAEDGRRITISPRYRRGREAMGIVLGRIVPPMVASVQQRLARGETVQFGPLALSATSLAWKMRRPVLVSEISRAEIAGSKLKIRCSGRWRSVIRVRCDRVPDALALLEVLQAIAPQLRPTRMDPLAKVRL